MVVQDLINPMTPKFSSLFCFRTFWEARMAALYFWVIGFFSKRGLNKIVFYLIHYYDCSIPRIIVKDISNLDLCFYIYVVRKCYW